MSGVRTIAARELLRAFLLRELGGRGGIVLLALSTAAGATAAVVSARLLALPPDTLPPGLATSFFLHYPASALYLVGLAYAWRTPGRVGGDEAAGWTLQYLAAGATRDRYLTALVLASALAALVVYLVTLLAWALLLSFLHRDPAALTGAAALLPVAVAWLAGAAAFGGAAVAVAGRAGAAQALMIGLLLLPWLAVTTFGPGLEGSPPEWIRLLFRLAPPYPVSASLRVFAASLLFAGAASAVAWLLSHRLLRVR